MNFIHVVKQWTAFKKHFLKLQYKTALIESTLGDKTWRMSASLLVNDYTYVFELQAGVLQARAVLKLSFEL